jgi:hypothetical protein
MAGVAKKSLAAVVLGSAMLFLGSALSYSRADEPRPDLSELRDAVKSADKRGANVHEVENALGALEKALAKGFKAPARGAAAPAELTALRNAVEAARKKGENVEEIHKQLELVEKAVTGQVRAAPKAKDAEPPPLYFPTDVGARWAYRRPSGDDPQYSVKASERKGDTVIASIRDHAYYMGDSVHWKIFASPEGLRKEEPRGENGWLLKTGLPSGSTWKGPGGATRTVFGPEEVKTRAGKFQVLRVGWYEGAEFHTVWYAPNIGEVKYVHSYRGETISEYELWSFTPPKKQK